MQEHKKMPSGAATPKGQKEIIKQGYYNTCCGNLQRYMIACGKIGPRFRTGEI